MVISWWLIGISWEDTWENIYGNYQFDTLKWKIASGYVKIAIENDSVEIVDLPIEHGDFP